MQSKPFAMLVRITSAIGALLVISFSACSPVDPPAAGSRIRSAAPERVIATVALTEQGLKLLGLRPKTGRELGPPESSAPRLEWVLESASGERLEAGSLPHPLRARSEFSHGAAAPTERAVGVGLFEVELPNRTGRFILYPPGVPGAGGSKPQAWGDLWEPLEVWIEELLDDVGKLFGDEPAEDEELEIGPTEAFVKPTSKCTAYSILVVSEGYTENERWKFLVDANEVRDALAEHLGKSNFAKVALWRTFFESRESGMSDPENGIVVDTAFRVEREDPDATFIWMADDVPEATLAGLTAAKAVSDADAVLVLVNSTIDGGGGNGAMRMGFFTTRGPDPAGVVAAHELGHALFALRDEYSVGSCNPKKADKAPNLARGEPFPWQDMLTEPVVIPTTELDPDIVGAYEGGAECATGVYRPQLTCLMRSLDARFCKVCKAHIDAKFRERAPACAPPKPDCGHGECETGAALAESCSVCAASVCDYRPECCDDDHGWTAECVAEAQNIPGACAGICAVEDSTCSHDECEPGLSLSESCSSCAASICEHDPFCCEHEWDQICASAAGRDPFCACGG